MKRALYAALLVTLPATAMAQEVSSICYSRGSQSDGMTGFVHSVDGRALRVDSPNSGEPRTRLTEWQDPDFANTFHDALLPMWGDIPADLLAQCDDGWRDTIVIRFDDGSTDMREGSCIRNPVAQALDAIFAQHASLVETPTRTYVDGAAEGVYAPCSHDW